MVDRITDRLPDGTAYVRSETGKEGTGAFTTQRRLPEIISKLAAYEDTGLDPADIQAVCAIAARVMEYERTAGAEKKTKKNGFFVRLRRVLS